MNWLILQIRLEKCFAKSILRFLKVNIFSLTGKDEYIFLAKFNILPLKYRLFFHFLTFVFNLFKNNNIFTTKDNNYTKNQYKTRNIYREKSFKTNYGKYSFLTISTKLLNSCIAKHLESDNLFSFKKSLRDRYNLMNLFNSSVRFWTE